MACRSLLGEPFSSRLVMGKARNGCVEDARHLQIPEHGCFHLILQLCAELCSGMVCDLCPQECRFGLWMNERARMSRS